MNNKFQLLAVLLGFMIASYPVQANIYKCVSKKGAVYYNDKPCPKRDKETQLKAVKDPKSKYIPKFSVEKKDATLSHKGVIVGEEQSEKVALKENSKKNKDEKLVTDKGVNANYDRASDSSKNQPTTSQLSPTAPVDNPTDKIPTVREEIKAVLGKAGNDKGTIEKYLSLKVQ